MLQIVSNLRGYSIEAKDGSIGTASDFLFDDSSMKVRWLVVDTGNWLTGRKVLIHPSAIVCAEHWRRELTVGLTKSQVKESPDIGQDLPVSLQMQKDLYNYYGWDSCAGGSPYGAGVYGGGLYSAGGETIPRCRHEPISVRIKRAKPSGPLPTTSTPICAVSSR